MVASALLLLLLFAMRRGVVGAGFEDSGIGMEDEVVVPERRRVLLRGGRFSVSVIVPKDDEGQVEEESQRGSLLSGNIAVAQRGIDL
jgi:ribosomal protein S6E (S10)